MTDLSALHRCGKPPEFVTSILNPIAGHNVFMFGERRRSGTPATRTIGRASSARDCSRSRGLLLGTNRPVATAQRGLDSLH